MHSGNLAVKGKLLWRW